MGVFVRAVVTGFGFSLGSALFKRISDRLGLEESSSDNARDSAATDGDGDGEPDEAEATT